VALVIAAALGTDFLEALGDDGGVVTWRQRRHVGLFARQAAGGAALAARTAAGELVCLGGVYAGPDGDGEAWFAAGAAFKAHTVAGVRALRSYFEVIGDGCAPLTVVALVRPEGVAGARLARWLGFEDDGPRETGFGLMQRWVRRFE
jgi:hypothetical protein